MAFNSYKEDEKVSTIKKTVTLGRLLKYLLKYKQQLIAVFAILAYCTAVGLINPLFLESAIDDYILPKNFRGLAILLAIALLLNTIWVVLVKIRMQLMAKVSNDAVRRIREEVFTKLQQLELTYFDSRPTGKILSRVMDDVNSMKGVLEQLVLTLLPEIITLVATATIMLLKEPRLALAGMVGVPILLVGIFTIEKINRVRWQINRKKSANLNAFIHEDVSGIRIVKTFAAENETQDTFDELNAEAKNSFIHAVRVSDAYSSIIEISMSLSMICMFAVGIKVIGPDELSVGLIVAFITYVSLFWQPISNLGDFYNQIIRSVAAAERVFEVIDEVPAIRDSENAHDLPEIKGRVNFEKVCFADEDDRGSGIVLGIIIPSLALQERNLLDRNVLFSLIVIKPYGLQI